MSAKQEKRSSIFRRFFRRKGRKSNHYNEDLNQDQLIQDIKSLNNDVSATQKAVSTLQEHMRQGDGSIKYLKNQVCKLQDQNDHLQQENKELVNNKHRLELDICRLQMKNERNDENYTQLTVCRAKLEEYEDKILKLGQVVDQCNAAITTQRNSFNAKEINFKSKIEKLVASEQIYAKEQESLRSKLSKTEGEKMALCKLMTEKDMLNEGRLRAAWIKFTEMRLARDRLQSIVDQKITTVSPVLQGLLESPVKSYTETKLLQQDMQIYRRDKLIEILEDKMKEYDPAFAVHEDKICSVYTDDSDVKFGSDEYFSETISTKSSDSQIL